MIPTIIMNFQGARTISFLIRKNLAYTKNIKQSTKFCMHRLPISKNLLNFQYWKLSFFSDGPPPKCWQCNYPHKSELFCLKCKALQKLPQDLNYFDIIGIEKDFDVSIEDVQKKYRQLQTLLHPDRFGQKSDKEKEISENLSALVNKAYNTLLHPLDRGLYMLQLHNVLISEKSTSSEPDFLIEIMEKNEEIEETNKNEKALELIKENRSMLELLTRQISEAFRNNDIDKAKKLLIKMKYYISIDNRLKKLKQDLCIVV